MSDHKNNFYKEKFTKLRAEQGQLRAENNQLRAEINQLRDEKGKLDDKILELEEENENLKDENENLKEENRKLKKTNNKEIDNEPVHNEMNEVISSDNDVMVEEQKIWTCDLSPDNAVMDDRQNIETSPEKKKTKGEEIKISNQSYVNNLIGETQDIEPDEQIKQTSIGAHKTEKLADDKKNIPPRALVVVCCHGTFTQLHKLDKRANASEDSDMMKNAWALYGCKVIEFFDQTNSFYKTDLIDQIKKELVPEIKLFVFVLSTHGEEKLEAKVGSNVQEIQHYFFTKDGQLNTQEFMNSIAAIEKVKETLKVFVMQTCRSRSVSKDNNKDHGCDIEVIENIRWPNSEVGKEVTGSKRNIPHDGINKADARPDTVEAEIHPADINKLKEGIHTFDTMELVPHCDDCIVLFSSMAGKYAFSTIQSLEWTGGWVVKALHDALIIYKSQDKVHILDLLTAVNSEVGKRDVNDDKNPISKSQSCFFHNIAFEEEDLYLHLVKSEGS